MKRDFCNRYEKLPFKAILLSMLIIFVCASAFCGCVSAEDDTKEVTTWDELKSNLTDSSVSTVILKNEIVTSTLTSADIIKINTTKTLKLNGRNINISKSSAERYFNVADKGSLTINGKGEIKCNKKLFWVENGTLSLESGVIINVTEPTTTGIVSIIGSQDESKKDYSNFILAEGATLSNFVYGVALFDYPPDSNDGDGYGIVVNIKGNLSSEKSTNDGAAITINGYLKPTNLNSDNLPKINIGGKTVINTPYMPAIYGAGYGKWTFEDGCQVTGSDALSIKAGNWIINGGEFTANGEYKLPPETWSNGPELTGAAVSITDNRVYAGNVSLVISGGKFISEHQSALYEGVNDADKSNSSLGPNGITITGGDFITHNETGKLYPIHIMNLLNKPVSVTLNGQIPFYPNLNLSAARWEKDANGNWTVTLKENIKNVESIDLRHVPEGKILSLKKDSYNFVKVSKDDKYLFDGWNDGTSDLPASTTEFAGGKVYTPIFTYIKQYDTGEEVEDDEPTPTIESTPIVTPTQNQTVTPIQNQTIKPTVKPTPEPKTVVIVENEVKFEDNKVITSITVPEGSSGSITFTQTEEKGMDEWIPESIEDSYSFDLSCDGEINGDSEIHFVMSDTILKSLGLTPEDVCLKHFEDGVWVKLKISYIILDDGTYYYTAVTKSFSPFEISFDAKSEEPTVTPTEEQPTQSPMPVLGLLAGLGAAALLVRRK